MKTREALRLVESSGAVLVRTRGSHKVFKLPNGDILSIPFSGKHTELSPGMQHKIKKALA